MVIGHKTTFYQLERQTTAIFVHSQSLIDWQIEKVQLPNIIRAHLTECEARLLFSVCWLSGLNFIYLLTGKQLSIVAPLLANFSHHKLWWQQLQLCRTVPSTRSSPAPWDVPTAVAVRPHASNKCQGLKQLEIKILCPHTGIREKRLETIQTVREKRNSANLPLIRHNGSLVALTQNKLTCADNVHCKPGTHLCHTEVKGLKPGW